MKGNSRSRIECVALALPGADDRRPLQKAAGHLLEKAAQLGYGEIAAGFTDLPGIQPCIGQLNADFGQSAFGGIDEGVDLGLAPVQGVFLTQTIFRVAAGGFDLVDDRNGGALKHPVDPAVDAEGNLRRVHPMRKR